MEIRERERDSLGHIKKINELLCNRLEFLRKPFLTLISDTVLPSLIPSDTLKWTEDLSKGFIIVGVGSLHIN